MTGKGWWDYFVATAGTADGATIAAAAGVSAPQVSRWKTGVNRPDADKVVRFARHYGKPPLEGLIAAGYIRPTEASAVITIPRPLSTLADEELINEVWRRMRRRGLVDEPQNAGVIGKRPALGGLTENPVVDPRQDDRHTHDLGRRQV